MMDIIQSETFRRWLSNLKDRQAVLRINARLRRLSQNNLGDAKPLRDGISELRIDYGPGYRVYFMQRGLLVIVLLTGGDKHTQDSDITRAINLAKDFKD
ncbi:MAG: type II toxin-antitoxin system RelE/ParE family toxin [Candidatus Competibacteraceae bacterium]|uniref:type II toxin-antitoxin system RelE/ParE family toxin n=1 Tax=Candidatus Contendibacter odensensis TaxID=1400860 RepID=UPI0004B3C12C|nr:type II toxin-antitoxin system RelE/ParE family toxin [Candidatus Contendobacter odensis]MBK8536280.1 type II toxin-antitoxin system RelE/ParE family toxin [Candidatus Competibacteraceae bacterium]MBK8752471.1 type II toxin-antitoxin system RelE/ParE family toxin [Candidatus Competibacteraceae bacterium]